MRSTFLHSSVISALIGQTRFFFVRFRETPNEECYRFEVEGVCFTPSAQTPSLSFTRENLHHSPLASHILSALPMVEEVTVGHRFVTVRRVPSDGAAAGAREFVRHFNSVHGKAIEDETASIEAAQKGDEQHSGSPHVEHEGLEEGTVTDLIAKTTWEELRMHVSALVTDHLYSGQPHLSPDAPHPHSDTEPCEGDSEVVLSIKELIRTTIRPLLQEDGGDIRFVGLFDDGEMRVELLGSCRRCRNSHRTLQDLIERTTRHWIPEVRCVAPLGTAEAEPAPESEDGVDGIVASAEGALRMPLAFTPRESDTVSVGSCVEGRVAPPSSALVLRRHRKIHNGNTESPE